MTPRCLSFLLASLLLCATAQADTIRTGVASPPIPTELNLLAFNATLAGLTVLGMVLGMRRRPGSHDQGGAIRQN